MKHVKREIIHKKKRGTRMNKELQTVAIVGLGAVGINFAQHLQKHMPYENLWIVADDKRIKRYQQEGVYYNDMRCDFHYVTPNQQQKAVDLMIFSTKFMGLEAAMKTAMPIIDEHTLIMSAINGISSEEVLAKHFSKSQIIYTVAQGMDATKVGNHVACTNMGELCFGDVTNGNQKTQIEQIAAFFDQTEFPYTIKEDILHHQWGKFMLNVGLNQVVAMHHGTYETIQKEGEARSQMLTAMREVQVLSEYEGIHLTKEEVLKWAALCDTLSPTGKPSMAQDVAAQRKTEVELFAYEVCKRARPYGIPTPMNDMLKDELTRIEASYETN